MKSTSRLTMFLVALLVQATTSSSMQLEHGGNPSSFGHQLPDATAIALAPQPFDQPVERPGETGRFRFGNRIDVDLDMQEVGSWIQLPDGTLIWRLRITSPGALSLSLSFKTFDVPAGASLFVYDDSRATVRGAYTSRNHNEDRRFAIQPVAGDALTLEYNLSPEATAVGEIRLSGVVHDFTGVAWPPSGSALHPPCQIDVNCPQGDPWRDQINATVQIQTDQFLCTGTLVNNTARDGDQLFLSANHCGGMNNSIFRFNYQTSGCATGPPGNQTVQGSIELITNTVPHDFRLVRITKPIPASYGAHFIGWDRSGDIPPSTLSIHHPNFFRKRISIDSDSPTITGFQEENWIVGDWDFGHLAPGSSGSPLFSDEGLYIGRGWGTVSNCTISFPTTFRRFFSEWPLIQHELDPMGTNEISIEGLDPFPIRLDATSPSTVEPLLPGTRQELTVLGYNLPPYAKVWIDGELLAPERYTVVDENEITIDLPLLPVLGEHTLTIVDGSDVGSIGLEVKEAAAPILQLGSGDWLAPITPGENVELVVSGGVGSLQWVLLSFSLVPSVSPIGALDIGNGFENLYLGGTYSIPQAGWALDHLTVPPGIGMEIPVYAQAVGWSDAGLQVSNVQSATIVP